MKKDLSLQIVENYISAYQMYVENALDGLKKYIEYNHKFQKISVEEFNSRLILDIGGDEFIITLEDGQIVLTLNEGGDFFTFETAKDLFESLEGIIDEEYS